jgi:hypothetical protein
MDALLDHRSLPAVDIALLQLLGLVARVAHSYLVLRARSLHALPHRAGLLSGGELEYIETAMQKVKRAGLGLLSKGLGR